MFCAMKYVLIAALISLATVVAFAQSTPSEAQPTPQVQSTSPGNQPAPAPAGAQVPQTGAQSTPGSPPAAGAQSAAEVRSVPAEVQAPPTLADKNASISKLADRFIDRLHQTLDVGALNEMFAADIASRYREYPGEFLPFSTPRMAKTLLKGSDDAALRRKLMADWNLAYLTSVLLKAGSNADPAKVFPPDFVKAAKKSNYLKPMIGAGGQVTLVTPTELNEYLAEADQTIPMLRRSVKPETLTTAFRTQGTHTPTLVPYGMGYDAVYTVPRESLLLVVVDGGAGEFKVVSLAAPSNN
jgi:hypothetical protein